MKKLTPKQRWFLLRVNRKRLRQCRLHCRTARSAKIKAWRNRRKPKRSLVHLKAPSYFDIFNRDNRAKLLGFLDRLEKHVKGGSKVLLNFDNTNELRASGTLMFVAKVECLIANYPGMIGCKYPKSEVVEQLFQHIGLLSKLGLDHRVDVTADNVKYWHYVHGSSTDTTGFKNLFSTYASMLNGSISDGLYDSMSEAVTNSIHHAYERDKETNDLTQKRWWMFAQHKDDRLTVVILDLGIGIPDSLRQKPELKEYIMGPYNRVRKRRDTALIEVAVHSGRTRTRLAHRGKGLPDMLGFVKTCDIGWFRILSQSGAFSYDAKYDLEQGSKDFKHPIPGTLIEWEIPLQPVNEDEH